jgi:hypothetical protein
MMRPLQRRENRAQPSKLELAVGEGGLKRERITVSFILAAVFQLKVVGYRQ